MMDQKTGKSVSSSGKPLNTRSEALRHWASAQSLTAAFFLLNGGIYSFACPEALFVVPGFAKLYSPFSATGAMAVLLALVIAFVELSPEKNGSHLRDSKHSLSLGLTYGIFSIFLSFQYTLVVPCSFLLITSLTLLADSWSLSRNKA